MTTTVATATITITSIITSNDDDHLVGLFSVRSSVNDVTSV
jgi:hypothetical protein